MLRDLTAADLAKPLTGETAEDIDERFIKEYVGDPRRMMEVLSFFNLLRELPPKEREELIKANRLAIVLEGGETTTVEGPGPHIEEVIEEPGSSSSSSTLGAIASHPITQAAMDVLQTMNPGSPLVQAA